MKEAYQCPVFHSYGSREFKLIAIECEKGGLHLSADNLLVECLHQGQPAARGQLGEVVITDLHNFGMPFLRYEIGDLASPGPDSCPCGRGLPLLQDVYGRIPDTIQTPDGLLIHGTFFGQLLMWFPCIDQFQVIQKQLDRIEVRLVPADPATARAQLSEIKAKMHSILGHQIQIVCEFCDEIPVTASGKHRVVISEIPVQI
jgi:phenylacetate-CoA ligase